MSTPTVHNLFEAFRKETPGRAKRKPQECVCVQKSVARIPTVRYLMSVVIGFVFANTSSAQMSFNPLPDMGLAQILPLPGKFGGYVPGANKDPSPTIILLAGEDDTKRILPAANPELPKRPDDITFTLSEERVAAFSAGKAWLQMKVIDLGGKDLRPVADLQAALESGRVVHVSKGYLTVSVADAKTKQIARRLRYTFSDQSTIAWHSQERALIWRGFSVKVE